ncbi:MAG: CdaR family protein [Ardenticatenaceae bacterium]|nr:CdaR family protein [Ardenticatenaceae bacterium]
MKILRTLLTDITTLGLSFILAMIIWVVAVRANDPIVDKSLELDITDRGLLPALGEWSASDDLVRITIEGPQSIVNPLTRSDFSAYIDLSEIPFGESQAPVYIDLASEEIEIVFQDPQTVDVVAEEIISRDIPVTVDIRGSAARGHTIGEPISDPSFIQVSGPEQRVSQIAQARITIFLEQPREDVTAVRRPTFIDQETNVVSMSGLNTSTNEIEVVLPVDEIAGVAEKPITVDWSGSPALGYRLLDVRAEPTSLVVSGSPTVIDGLRSVSTEEIDISGLNESFTQQVALVFPDGVNPDEVESVFVTVEIEPIFTIDVVRRIPEFRALGEDLTAMATPEQLTIFLFGPLPALESINEEDVTVTLDLLDLGPGEYNLRPIVTVSANEIEIRSTEPETITVVIEEAEIGGRDESTGAENTAPTTESPTLTPVMTTTP